VVAAVEAPPLTWGGHPRAHGVKRSFWAA
jgi:hypothetical protein